MATLLAAESRNRRAGEMLGRGVPADDIGAALGQTAEAVASVPLLAERAGAAGVDAPALQDLARLIEGSLAPDRWAAAQTAASPPVTRRSRAA